MKLVRRVSPFFTLLIPCLLAGMTGSTRAAGLFDGADSGGSPSMKLEPGKEVHVRDSDVGGREYYTVYLPTDYDGHHPFPIIFNYHGQFEEPQSTPFKQITGGEGFIIVGMEYQTEKPPDPTTPAANTPKSGPRKLPPVKAKPATNEKDQGQLDSEVLRRVAALIRADLQIDQKQMFIGGFGQGAVEAQLIAARTPDLWAGVIVLGAGDAGEPGNAKGLVGKPILIAIGETDQDFASAKQAADAYKKLGADVTLTTFPNRGHEVDAKNPALKQWLINYGPQRQVHAAMAAGEAAEKSNRLGEAIVQYSSVAKMNATPQDAKTARDAARLLSDKGREAISAADDSLNSRNFPAAAKQLVEISTAYAGSDFATRANDRLKSMEADAAAGKAIAQAKLDGEADSLESQAIAAEQSKNYPRAIATYELYLTKYPTSHRFAAVKTKLAAIQSDKSITAGMDAKQADADCRSWLSLADNFIESGLPEKARPYLQKIIDTYGTTPWADQAKARLKQIEN